MTKLMSFSVILFLLSVVCARFVGVERPVYQSTGDDEYDVYSAILLHIFAWTKAGVPKLIVVKQKTRGSRTVDRMISSLVQKGEVDSILADDFIKKNENLCELENKFGIPESIALVTDYELEEITRGSGSWDKNFGAKYPNAGGLITFSRIGFNRDFTQALAYFGQTSGPLTGSGHLVILAKKDSIWKVQKTYVVWIA